jgi:hypothetical protein
LLNFHILFKFYSILFTKIFDLLHEYKFFVKMISTLFLWISQIINGILSLSYCHIFQLFEANEMKKYAARKYTYSAFNWRNYNMGHKKESKLFILSKSLIWLPIDVTGKNCKVKMSDFWMFGQPIGQPKNKSVILDAILHHENNMKKNLTSSLQNIPETLINEFELKLPFSKVQVQNNLKVRAYLNYEKMPSKNAGKIAQCKMTFGDPIVVDAGKFWNNEWSELASIDYLAELFLYLENAFPEQGELIFKFLGISGFCPKREKKLKLE